LSSPTRAGKTANNHQTICVGCLSFCHFPARSYAKYATENADLAVSPTPFLR
jgi:hypothetical protein